MSAEPAAGGDIGEDGGGEQRKGGDKDAQNPGEFDAAPGEQAVEDAEDEDQDGGFGKKSSAAMGGGGEEVGEEAGAAGGGGGCRGYDGEVGNGGLGNDGLGNDEAGAGGLGGGWVGGGGGRSVLGQRLGRWTDGGEVVAEIGGDSIDQHKTVPFLTPVSSSG